MKSAIAIRHVAFEDAGSLAPALERAGWTLQYLEAWRDDLSPAVDADLAIVLGGPIGAYEEAFHPFILSELSVLEARLAADRPTLGICLGAQLIARALGAPVFPGGAQEVGWGALSLTADAREGLLSPLEGVPVLHWHGDTFDLPAGCELLASTRLYRHQAFARGSNLLALQFHIEATAQGLEAWYVGHAGQLAGLKISPAELRAETARLAPACEMAAAKVFDRWLAGL